MKEEKGNESIKRRCTRLFLEGGRRSDKRHVVWLIVRPKFVLQAGTKRLRLMARQW